MMLSFNLQIQMMTNGERRTQLYCSVVGCCRNVLKCVRYFSIFLTSHRLADTGLECIILVCRKSAVGLPTVGVPYVNSKQPPSSCFLEKTNYFKLDRRPKTEDRKPTTTKNALLTNHQPSQHGNLDEYYVPFPSIYQHDVHAVDSTSCFLRTCGQ